MSSLTVRTATVEDIEAVEAVLEDGKEALRRQGLPQWQQPGYPSRAVIEEDVAQGAGCVAVDENGSVLGYLALRMDGEPMYDKIDGAWLTASTSAAPRYATIHRTAVSAAAARRGVMRTLFSAAEERSRAAGAESMRIDTHERNAPMRNLVEGRGFTYCGVVTLLRPEPEPDRVAYEKLL